MFIDYYNQFDPAGTAITVTTDSTNTLDMGVARDIGAGSDPVPDIAIYVGTAFTGTSTTMTISLSGAPDNGSGSPGSFEVLAVSRAFSLTDLAANAKLFAMQVPAINKGTTDVIPRFYKLTYTVASGPFTAGTLSARLVLDREDWISYAKNFTLASVA